MSALDPCEGPTLAAGTVIQPDMVDTSAAGGMALRGGALRAIGYAVGRLLALLSAPLLIRHLGDAQFGQYSAVLAVIAIAGGLTEGGVNTIALRELSTATDREARDRAMGDLLGLRLVLSALGVVIAVAFSAVAGYGAELVLGTLLAGVGLIAALTQSLLAAVLQSRLRFGWAATIEVLRQAITTALIVALVIAGGGVVIFLSMAIPASLCAAGLTAFLIRDSVNLRPSFRMSRWVPLMRDTAVFAVAVAVNTLYFRVTLVILSLVATAAQTGYFAVSFRIMEVLVGLPVLLIGAAFPIISRAAHANRDRFDQMSSRIFELALFVGVLTAVALILAAPFAIDLLVGSSTHPSVGVLQIQAVGIIATFVAAATGFPLLSLHRHRETLIANCASLLAATVLTLVLAPSLGARGAATGAVVAECALAALNTAFLVRNAGVHLPLTAIPVTLGLGAAAYVAADLLDVHPLIDAAVGSVLFLAAVCLAGRFPLEITELLAGRRGHAGDAPPPRTDRSSDH